MAPNSKTKFTDYFGTTSCLFYRTADTEPVVVADTEPVRVVVVVPPQHAGVVWPQRFWWLRACPWLRAARRALIVPHVRAVPAGIPWW